MSELIQPIPTEMKNPWVVAIDGNPVQAREIRISNPQFGTLSFGQRPEGTIGWIWKEVGGGGVGIVPYVVQNARLFIGMINQERPCQGGMVWNIPRGFLDPKLTHFETAVGESEEELGINVGERLAPLLGLPANSNSTFFDTTDPGAGFNYYFFKVLPEEVEGDPPVFRKSLFRPKSIIAERIVSSRFFPWFEAATVADQFSNVGVARLIAHHQVKGIPLPLG